MYKFAIIGSGVVGGLIADILSRYEKNIAVLEKENDCAMGQSKANSGIVHAGYDPEPGSLKALLNVKGCKMMAETCRRLNVKYKKNGTLVVGFDDADAAYLKKLYERGIVNGVEELSLIDGDAARVLEPNLSEKITTALYAKSAGIVCPYELAIHSLGHAMDNGAEFLRNFEVVKLEKGADWTIFAKDGRKVEAEYVINCAGVYSDKIAAMAGDDSIEITPRRGEYFLLDKEAGDLVSMTIFRTPTPMGKGVLAVKTVDGNILLGPTSEDIDEKEDKSVTAAGLDAVREKEKEFFDAIPWDKVITQFTGVRSKGNTGDFIINSPVDKFINCAGVESPGLTASPAIAEYVRDMLIGMGALGEERSDYVAEAAKPVIFKNLSEAEKHELIAKRPEYGHIVCRCEEVTEGEIVDAIRRNPKAADVDGVKRRTRAGMGRCQGGFCLPIVLEILARELGEDYTEITKKGENSEYSYYRTKTGGELRSPEKKVK